MVSDYDLSSVGDVVIEKLQLSLAVYWSVSEGHGWIAFESSMEL